MANICSGILKKYSLNSSKFLPQYIRGEKFSRLSSGGLYERGSWRQYDGGSRLSSLGRYCGSYATLYTSASTLSFSLFFYLSLICRRVTIRHENRTYTITTTTTTTTITTTTTRLPRSLLSNKRRKLQNFDSTEELHWEGLYSRTYIIYIDI